MCKIDGTEKNWIDFANDTWKGIVTHARSEYDTFLEKILKPYGICKRTAVLYADRVTIEEENPHIEGFELVSYRRFYIDGEYKFTVVIKQGPTASGMYNTGFQFTYEAVVEQDLVPKKKTMTNKEAIEILETARGMAAESDEDEAFTKAIVALRYMEMIDEINTTGKGKFK